MSDSMEVLVDVEATIDEAAFLERAVLNRFRDMDIIAGEANNDCVLGGEGYRPGSAVPRLYVLAERESPFWTLRICGVEPHVGRHFNLRALGPVFEHFKCPSCDAELRNDSFKYAVVDALDAWSDQSSAGEVRCPICAVEHAVTDWHCKPPLGFGNLSFTFWNWPPLDSSSWKVNLARIVEKTTRHRVVSTHGHM